MSRRQRGYPWPSLAISPYHSSPPAGLQGYILCPHIVAVCKFVLVVLLLHIHMWGSIGVHHLWARPCFSSSVPRVYIYIYIYEERFKKKKNDPKFSEFIMKVDVEHFGCNNLFQGFKFMKTVVKIAMDVWWNNRRNESVYKKKDSKQHILFSTFFILSDLFPYLHTHTHIYIYIYIYIYMCVCVCVCVCVFKRFGIE